MTKPVVSIMMPAYNAEAFIADAIESVIRQTYLDWELCIVDDGSDDDTYNIALGYSFKDNRIRVDQIEHQGCPAARNHCLDMMNGEIYAKQDADDLQDPTRLEKQIDLLLTDLDLDIVTCRYNWLRNNKITPRSSEGMNIKLFMLGRGGYPCNASIVAWNYVYTRIGGYKTDQLAGSDGDWIFRAIMAGFKWGHVPENLYTQRRHKTQLSQSMRDKQRQVHETARKYYYEQWLKASNGS